MREGLKDPEYPIPRDRKSGVNGSLTESEMEWEKTRCAVFSGEGGGVIEGHGSRPSSTEIGVPDTHPGAVATAVEIS
jgi:hypothetical protein